MYLLRALSHTAIGRALIAYFFDLPRWTLANILFAISLVPLVEGLRVGDLGWIILFTLPAMLTGAGIINLAAGEVHEEIPRWRNIFAHPTTYITSFMIWGVVIIVIALLFDNLPLSVRLLICVVALVLLMIGVFALLMPALLNVRGALVWRNALVLTVHYPLVALGFLALLTAGAWVVWISKGALLLIVPALWVMIVVFSTDDLIETVQSGSPQD